MKNLIIGFALMWPLAACSTASQKIAPSAIQNATSANSIVSVIENKDWLHGSATCETDKADPIDVLKLDNQTFILRQNKCTTFEAPFLYLLIGSDKALLFDTGAISDASVSPVASAVEDLLQQYSPNQNSPGQTLPLVVLHSHGHNDHTAGDNQFSSTGTVTIISSDIAQAGNQLGFTEGFRETNLLSLGERKLTIIPTPGHHKDAISLYDEKYKLLLTGDTLYPGLIYVKNWEAYRHSIKLLFNFSEKNEVNAVLGAHIEMSNTPFTIYPVGSTFQRNEASVVLKKNDIDMLHKALQTNPKARRVEFEKFIVQPMSWLQRTISNIATLFF